MPPITVTAKRTEFHPATGLHLQAGETYTINDDQFSAEVFDTKDEEAAGQGEEE